MAAEASSDSIYRLVATALDTNFYRAIYDDVAVARVDPVRHYVTEGWREGRDPAPWFSTAAYLETNPDVEGLNPFHHYLSQGWREGREAQASSQRGAYLWWSADERRPVAWDYEPPAVAAPAARPSAVVQDPAQVRALVEPAFDPDHYLAANPDVAAAGVDPLEHFLVTGWREGRDPSRSFSVADYLEFNPDVAAAGINPFAHYLDRGHAERRSSRSELGFRHQIIADLIPLGERVDAAQRRASRVAPGALSALEAALARTRAGDGALHISVSHDDFTANVGGVQLCLQREAAAIAAERVDHLHLYPTTHWPTLRTAEQPAAIGVLWNGERLGAFSAQHLAQALGRMGAAGGRRSFALHSLLGHAVEDVLAVLSAAGLSRGYFWLHDFTSLCAGVHLMRDDVADCGAPPAGSAACGICVYGPWRAAHVDAHARLFAALDLTVVAPSRSAFETWRAATAAPADQPHVIHPHAVLERRAAEPKVARQAGPLTVAFLGMPAAHKGWPAFCDLAARFAGDPRYRFMHLASRPAPGAPFEHHAVSVNADHPQAMREALESLSVDVALIWSLCRETFSFTAYEAAAAGVAVLTGPDSGNVAAFTAEGGFGRVLADEAELAALFASGEVLGLARDVRGPSAYDLVYSALTVDLLGAAR